MTLPKGFYDPESSAWDRQNHAGALPNIVARHMCSGGDLFFGLLKLYLPTTLIS